jgi:WD40 repeat protein
MTGHTDRVLSVAVTPDGTRVVSGSEDNTIRVCDLQSGAAVGEPMTGHTYRVSSVAVSPDGSLIVSGSWDSTLRVWPVCTGESLLQVAHYAEVQAVAVGVFGANGGMVAARDNTGAASMWTLRPPAS